MRHCARIDVHLILRKGNNILLGQRRNSGFYDGAWHLPSGHGEQDESAMMTLIRESTEEIGVKIDSAVTRLVHVMHHRTDSDRFAMFFEATSWAGQPRVCEPDKCAAWQWFKLDALPVNMIPYASVALQHYAQGVLYSELGWR